jgi:two-component system, LytTR family, response regulator
MSIKVMITEDDLLSRLMLCDLLADYFPDVHIIAMTQNVKDSIAFLKDHKTDLLFLDIELPDGKGFDILRSLQHWDFKVIVTMSYSRYEEELSSFNVLCAIVKPVTHQSLEKAMEILSAKKTIEPVVNH